MPISEIHRLGFHFLLAGLGVLQGKCCRGLLGCWGRGWARWKRCHPHSISLPTPCLLAPLITVNPVPPRLSFARPKTDARPRNSRGRSERVAMRGLFRLLSPTLYRCLSLADRSTYQLPPPTTSGNPGFLRFERFHTRLLGRLHDGERFTCPSPSILRLR